MSEPVRIEVLGFAGCPNTAPTLKLVQRVVATTAVDAVVEQIEVETQEQVEELRFLGSPTVRVNGRDVEPGADARPDYIFSCRIYRDQAGVRGQPDERWLRAALGGND
jgi:hypothetical protein